ncbi:ABC transporter permease subunit [Modicisalibacter tunisiensis]|uniref:ABC transporter permease n=1 Tax=Modicisalibacter tunisiensis TaxID=390637 RepID=UPI001CCF00E2|nr:ABC transporter permease subunit [Modicisalibacter tunisiensis]MBZ9537371.1 ABC transporter permease subunit [Modicisalibacter tunisiensis]
MSGHLAWTRLARWLTVGLIGLPIVAGLLGVIAPAFGWLPALGGTSLSLAPWQALARVPGLAEMIRLSAVTGLASTLLSLACVALLLGACLQTRAMGIVRRLLSPLLAVPHAAAAIGLAFLLAPSGLASRAISPWPSGWQYPPDYLFPQDPGGLALILGLTIKEVPFLLLMSLAALPQCDADARLRVARGLGYRPAAAFFKAVLPGLYPLLRLPIYAVIAFATATVDVALILGPSTPPPLSVMVLRWFHDPDLSLRFMASAGALTQLGVTLAALAVWCLLEMAVIRLCRGWSSNGRRSAAEGPTRVLGAGLPGLALLLLAGSLIGLVLWSLAGYWRFPAVVPPLTLDNWYDAAGAWAPLTRAIIIGAAATAVALVLVVGTLEAEAQRGGRWQTALIYLPLLVPQSAFLFGLVQWQAAHGPPPGLGAVIAGHTLFVLPYVYLVLAESYRRLDPRWSQLARSLGASPGRVFRRVRLPLLAVPLMSAAAVGFAVSIGQYLPTLLLGAGRVATITTVAVSLASGGDRRLTAVHALLQLLLPAVGFALALGLPRLLFRHRSGLMSHA